MKVNIFGLGRALSEEEYMDLYSFLEERTWSTITHRASEYFSVFQKNLGPSHFADAVTKAYSLDEWAMDFMPTSKADMFVTDDKQLAAEMIRVLDMDFIHEIRTGLFIFDIYGSHELIMVYIAQAVFSDEISISETISEGAEAFVKRGLGCFRSTQSPYIFIGEDIAIPSYLSTFKSIIRRQ